MDTISLPISFRQGYFEKFQDGTDEYYAFLLSMAMQIEPGELPITVNYGCYSPLFNNQAITNLAIAAAQFVPEIDLVDVDVVSLGGGQVQIDVSFTQGIQQFIGLEE